MPAVIFADAHVNIEIATTTERQHLSRLVLRRVSRDEAIDLHVKRCNGLVLFLVQMERVSQTLDIHASYPKDLFHTFNSFARFF